MPAPRAVLFDFDGVIADTENVHVAAWERTFGAMGWDVPAEQCARAAEIDDRAFLAEVFAERKIEEGDLDGWVARKQRLAAAMLADEPRLYPGVAELVGRLAGRARLAVVSTARREDIRGVLRAGGLLDAFAAIVGKEDVRATKPDPEPYRAALERLGVGRVRGGRAGGLGRGPGLGAVGGRPLRGDRPPARPGRLGRRLALPGRPGRPGRGAPGARVPGGRRRLSRPPPAGENGVGGTGGSC